MKNIYWLAIISALVVIIAFMHKCQGPRQTIVVKKGIPHVERHYRIDTVDRIKEVAGKTKIKVIVKHDTLYASGDTGGANYTTSSSYIEMLGYKLSISDTTIGDSTNRVVTMTGKDTTTTIIKRDSVTITRTDTAKVKGSYWRGLKHGFAVGFVAGAALGVSAK